MSIPTPPSPENLASSSQASPQPSTALAHLLLAINRLVVRAFNANSKESLIFKILNDTVNVVRYDRAMLWDFSESKPKLLGVSGQPSVNEQTELAKNWNKLIPNLIDPRKIQIITKDSFRKNKDLWEEIRKKTDCSVLWLPIFVDQKFELGLWLENWHSKGRQLPPEVQELLSDLLLPGYASAWSKFKSQFSFRKLLLKKEQYFLIAVAFFLLLSLIRVPLRIVAPSEVVPKDPYLITAPLEGIISEIVVNPGQSVQEGMPLVEYDKRVPLQELKIAQKEVQIIEAEYNRANTLGLKDDKSLSDLTLIQLKLQKAQLQLALAEYKASQLTIKSPDSGIAMLENPDDWRGKPVRVGEKILTIGDPKRTKVRIWIPEVDNIILDPKEPVNVILNVMPDKTFQANLIYVANETVMSDKQVPSFVAEADWVDETKEEQENIKLGLKGTAILYGERVTLFYYIVRKPWSTLRELIGF